MRHLKSQINKFKKSSITTRIAKGAFWSLIGSVCAKTIVLIAGIICANILGKEQFGEFGIIRSTINMFVALGSLGLGLTATKYISEYLKNNKESIPSIYLLTNRFGLATSLLITVIVFILAPIIATESLESPYLANDIRLGSILLLFTILNGVQSGILAGFENFKAIAINTFIGNTTESVLMILGAFYFGVSGAILGFGLGYIVLFIANIIVIKKTLISNQISITNAKIDNEHYRLIYKFCIPATLSSLMVSPVIWYAQSVLVRYSGYGEVAIYEAANQWRIIILFIPSTVCQVVLPILSSLSNNNNKTFWNILNANIILNGTIALILSLFVCLCSDWLMGLYGNGFSNSYVITLLSASTIFSSISSVIGLSISSRGKMWTGFIFNSLWGIILIIFSLYFITNGMGAIGLALAMLLSYFIHSIYQYIYLKIIISTKSIDSKLQS